MKGGTRHCGRWCSNSWISRRRTEISLIIFHCISKVFLGDGVVLNSNRVFMFRNLEKRIISYQIFIHLFLLSKEFPNERIIRLFIVCLCRFDLDNTLFYKEYFCVGGIQSSRVEKKDDESF